MLESQAELSRALRKVPGFFGDEEAWALHEAVRCHRSNGVFISVVEIGSWMGRSTIALAHAVRARGAGTVHAIDPHRDSALHRSLGERDTRAAFLANVRRAGVARYVRSLRSLSTSARRGFRDGSVDVLFVDGAHDPASVIADIDAWTSALADGAAVGFHDIVYFGVRQALRERVLRRGSPFHDLRVIENTLLADFRPTLRWTWRDTRALGRATAAVEMAAERRQTSR